MPYGNNRYRREKRDSLFDEEPGKATEYFDPLVKSIDIINRVVPIMTEIRMLQDDIKEIYREASEYDLDISVLKEVIRRRSQSRYEKELRDTQVAEIELKLEEEGADNDFDDD